MKVKFYIAILFRMTSVLCGIFCLFIPKREIAEWSLFRICLYYLIVVGYILIASVRIRKISQSLCLTTVLICIAAVPLLSTLTQVIESVLKSDLVGSDVYAWGGLIFVSLLEMLLPLALLIEFRSQTRNMASRD